VEIGAHSHTHPELDVLPSRLVQSEIERPEELLEERLQSEVASFAYPHGHANAHVRRKVCEAGSRSACAARNTLSHAGDDLYFMASSWRG
jgi:peptidoglycan/xylan/chitin deacetylase (PgdA/CDA1 family)